MVVIDHHRMAVGHIDNPILLYHEPFASSASELVCELLQFMPAQNNITQLEAQALLSGIMLDTRSFALHVGVRTFEAAALLRRCGANPNLIRQLFKDDLSFVQQKAKLIAGAKMPIPGLSIAIMRNADNDTMSSVLAAQTAATLITIESVAEGMAIVEYNDGSQRISARSDGSVNVQVIMEELGGGGHQTVAGVQLANKRARDVEAQIIALTKKQLEECRTDESNSFTRC